MKRQRIKLGIVFGLIMTAGLIGSSEAKAAPADKNVKQGAADNTLEVQLCDGKTTTQVPKGMKKTRENGQKVANDLMAQWKAAHPEAQWVEQETEKHTINRPADNSDLVGQGQGSTYGSVTKTDVAIWSRETFKLVADGSRIFHSSDALGSDIGVSCDMCHPNAANTHPETYPKYQVQLGRVALLRDMINWCLEHPVHAKKLAPDSHKMRALEAYLLAQRKGVALDYGKR